MIKHIWLTYKVKSYEKLIRSLMVAREKLKAKQLKATERYEHYKRVLDNHEKV